MLYHFPSEAFSNPFQFAVDTLRLVTILLDGWIVVWMMHLGFRLKNTRQWGCYSISAYAAGAIVGQFLRLGTPMTPSLVLFAIGTLCGMRYILKVRRYEVIGPLHRKRSPIDWP